MRKQLSPNEIFGIKNYLFFGSEKILEGKYFFKSKHLSVFQNILHFLGMAWVF